MKATFGFVFAIVIWSFTNCRLGNGSSDIKVRHDTSETLTIKIPNNLSSFTEENRKNWLDSVFSLSSLHRKKTQLGIRIITTYLDNSGKVFDLSNNDNAWSAEQILFKIIGRRDSISFRKISLGSPQLGWKNFASKISEFDLKKLEIQRRRREQFDTEKEILDVEILNNGNYSFNNYWDVSKATDPNSKALYDLLAFFRKQFSID